MADSDSPITPTAVPLPERWRSQIADQYRVIKRPLIRNAMGRGASPIPNGNLIISGSQEVRVNFELRNLTVAGIVHPNDISNSNTINYDRIAEARISYGGRGRLTEVQQPGWGQQIYDAVTPF